MRSDLGKNINILILSQLLRFNSKYTVDKLGGKNVNITKKCNLFFLKSFHSLTGTE